MITMVYTNMVFGCIILLTIYVHACILFLDLPTISGKWKYMIFLHGERYYDCESNYNYICLMICLKTCIVYIFLLISPGVATILLYELFPNKEV